MLGALTFYYTPDLEEILSLGKMMLLTIAYLYTFFSIAFLISAVVKSSSTALTIAIGIFIVLALLLPLFSNYIAQTIAGSPPENPFGDLRNLGNISRDDPRVRSYMEEMQSYREKIQKHNFLAVDLLSSFELFDNFEQPYRKWLLQNC